MEYFKSFQNFEGQISLIPITKACCKLSIVRCFPYNIVVKRMYYGILTIRCELWFHHLTGVWFEASYLNVLGLFIFPFSKHFKSKFTSQGCWEYFMWWKINHLLAVISNKYMLTLLLLSQRASGALCSRAGWEFCRKSNLQWRTSTFSLPLIRSLCCIYMRSFYYKLSISTFTLIWQWVQKVCHFKFCLSFLQTILALYSLKFWGSRWYLRVGIIFF